MIRTQIQLTEQQAARVKRIARARGVSMATVIREAVDRLGDEAGAGPDQAWQRALAVEGYRDRERATDVAVDHDRYLAEAYGG